MADISYGEVITSTGTLPDGESITSTGILPDNVVDSINSKLDGIRKIDKKLGGSVFINSLGTSLASGKKAIDNLIKAGYERGVICVHQRYDGTISNEIAPVWRFCISVDDLALLVEHANTNNFPVSVKIHTKFANDMVAMTSLDTEKKKEYMDLWKTNHLEYLEEIVRRALNIEWISDFNESDNIPNYTYVSGTDSEGNDIVENVGAEFMKNCLHLLKWGVSPSEITEETQRVYQRVGISFNKNSFEATGDDIINECNFIALNTYPAVGFSTVQNAKLLTKDDLIEAFKWTDVKGYIRWMHEKYVAPNLPVDPAVEANGPQEIIISETGCGRYWENYNNPAANLKEPITNSDFQTTARYMDAITEYLSTSLVSEINYWCTVSDSFKYTCIDEILAKWKGEKL